MKTFAMMAMIVLAACGGDERGAGATGTLEMVEVDLAPMQPARVVEMRVREGDAVRAGQVLAVLEQAATESQVPQTEARVSFAQARLRDLQAGPRAAEIARAQAELRARQAEADRAARELQRIRALEEAGAISRQALDNARAAASLAAAQRDAARESVRVLRDGARSEQVQAARAEVTGAEAALQAARRTAGELTLVAPADGVVITRIAEPGEVLGAGQPALTVGDPRRPWTRVYVGAATLPLLRTGQTVTATLDGHPDPTFRGRIASINPRAEFTPRVALTEDEREDLLFGVRVEFDDGTGMLKAGLPLTVALPIAEKRP
ncbi:HlyD family efflux transporter periplasmic adaptor subunit [Longimicrobium sp.]|jgi:HlyD family secretion protein|uniref:HlyD family efflux transporter periplasmic adaptor subunit n=1 Tax=Longimicrobium sp. TaxID=2029185 RepID=UPI002F92C58A